MTSAQVVETSVNVISNSPSQDYTHPDDRTSPYDMTPGFKPFTNHLQKKCLLGGHGKARRTVNHAEHLQLASCYLQNYWTTIAR